MIRIAFGHVLGRLLFGALMLGLLYGVVWGIGQANKDVPARRAPAAAVH